MEVVPATSLAAGAARDAGAVVVVVVVDVVVLELLDLHPLVIRAKAARAIRRYIKLNNLGQRIRN